MKRFQVLTEALTLTALSGAVTFAADAPAKADKAKAYPLTTCVVSGEKLGEMGKPVIVKHEGREVQLCCKNCVKDFTKDPAKFIKKLDEAGKAEK